MFIYAFKVIFIFLLRMMMVDELDSDLQWVTTWLGVTKMLPLDFRNKNIKTI